MTPLVVPKAMPQARSAAPTTRAPRAWLVSPWFDALFLANVTWPLLFLLLLVYGPSLHEGVRFWQVYFITAAHRWLTLPLVFLDRERFRERPFLFSSLAAAAVLVCLGVRISTGALTCLLAIDYLWNAWHFASQHAGILRIYSRQPGGGAARGTVEKLLMRLFLLYVILRMSGLEWALLGEGVAAIGWATDDWSPARLAARLAIIDWISLTAPLLLVSVTWSRGGITLHGRNLYLTSCLSLYVAVLMAAHYQRDDLVVLLATLSALFHATEYLAIVSWAVQKRYPEGRSRPENLFAALVPQWGLAITCFAVGLAVMGWISDQRTLEIWLLLNVIAAFLHYAYDGLIWKHSRPNAPPGGQVA